MCKEGRSVVTMGQVFMRHCFTRQWPFRRVAVALLLATTTAITSSSTGLQAATYDAEAAQRYLQLQQEGQSLFNQGQLSEAIARFEQALPLTPDTSLGAAHNNLAAAYLRRGQYWQSQQQWDKALNDYRQGYYLLTIGWPPGVPQTSLHQGNAEIARKTLSQAYSQLSIPTGDPGRHLQLARQLRQNSQFREAAIEYAWAGQLQPNSREPWIALGDLFVVFNQMPQAAYYYRKAVDAKTDAPLEDAVLVRLGNALNKLGDFDGALAVLNQASDQNPDNLAALTMLEGIWVEEVRRNHNNPLAHANLATVYQKKKRYDLAEQAYLEAERLTRQQPDTPLATKTLIRLNLGTLYQAMGKPAIAEEAYLSVLKREPGNAQATAYLASLYTDTRQPDKARALYLRALAQHPTDTALLQGFFQLLDPLPKAQQVTELQQALSVFNQQPVLLAAVGERLHQLGALDAAITSYETALKLDPNDGVTWANLAIAQRSKGNTSQANAALQRAKTLASKNPAVQQVLDAEAIRQQKGNLAQARQWLENPQTASKAIPALKAALKANPNDAALYQSLGYAYANGNQWQPAEETYLAGAARFPQDAAFPLGLGVVYQQQQQWDKARQAYRQALTLNPQLQEAQGGLQAATEAQADALLDASYQAYQQQQYAKAVSLADRAIALVPETAMAHYYRGLALLEQKQTQPAIAALLQSVRLKPDLAEAHYSLGLAYDSQDNRTLALQAYRQFLAGTSSSSDAANKPLLEYARQRVSELEQSAS